MEYSNKITSIENNGLQNKKSIPKSSITSGMEVEIEVKISNDTEKNSFVNNKENPMELNTSISTYCSNTSKSMNDSINSLDKSTNKKEEHEIIFKIVKINNKKNNTIFKDEYLDEIYQNFILDEKLSNLKINSNYMKKQNNINDKMRAILVDWLIEVHRNYNFKRKTLFQTIYIIDLYLSYEIVHKEHLQLLGVASLLISAKENEVIYPSLEEFISITDNAYNKSQLLKMEIHVLKALNFEVIIPTAEEYYNILSKIFNFNKTQHHLGEYFLDSALVDYNMLKYNYSTIGLACIYIVMKFYGLNGYKDLYSSKLIMGFSSQKMIKDCAKDLCFLVKNLSKSYLKAAKEKYSSKKYDNVAAICEEK